MMGIQNLSGFQSKLNTQLQATQMAQTGRNLNTADNSHSLFAGNAFGNSQIDSGDNGGRVLGRGFRRFGNFMGNRGVDDTKSMDATHNVTHVQLEMLKEASKSSDVGEIVNLLDKVGIPIGEALRNNQITIDQVKNELGKFIDETEKINTKKIALEEVGKNISTIQEDYLKEIARINATNAKGGGIKDVKDQALLEAAQERADQLGDSPIAYVMTIMEDMDIPSETQAKVKAAYEKRPDEGRGYKAAVAVLQEEANKVRNKLAKEGKKPNHEITKEAYSDKPNELTPYLKAVTALANPKGTLDELQDELMSNRTDAGAMSGADFSVGKAYKIASGTEAFGKSRQEQGISIREGEEEVHNSNAGKGAIITRVKSEGGDYTYYLKKTKVKDGVRETMVTQLKAPSGYEADKLFKRKGELPPTNEYVGETKVFIQKKEDDGKRGDLLAVMLPQGTDLEALRKKPEGERTDQEKAILKAAKDATDATKASEMGTPTISETTDNTSSPSKISEADKAVGTNSLTSQGYTPTESGKTIQYRKQTSAGNGITLNETITVTFKDAAEAKAKKTQTFTHIIGLPGVTVKATLEAQNKSEKSGVITLGKLNNLDELKARREEAVQQLEDKIKD